jgi:ferritin
MERNIYRIGKEFFITSEEEIKLDWYLDTTVNMLFKNDKIFLNGFGYKKIILTTDTQLIADGVQAIDDEFLEWFVKNPSCEEVEVESFVNGNVERIYEIIIPKEEPKQESYICLYTRKQCDDECCVSAGDCYIKTSLGILSELNQEIIATEEDAKIFVDAIENPPAPNEKLKNAFEKQLNQETTLEEDLLDTAIQIVGDSDCTTIKEFFVKHNWQQEQDKNKYSEEEVRDMLFEALNHKKEECCITHTTDSIVRKIIKQFKNK